MHYTRIAGRALLCHVNEIIGGTPREYPAQHKKRGWGQIRHRLQFLHFDIFIPTTLDPNLFISLSSYSQDIQKWQFHTAYSTLEQKSRSSDWALGKATDCMTSANGQALKERRGTQCSEDCFASGLHAHRLCPNLRQRNRSRSRNQRLGRRQVKDLGHLQGSSPRMRFRRGVNSSYGIISIVLLMSPRASKRL
jgi:hypothetical protein